MKRNTYLVEAQYRYGDHLIVHDNMTTTTRESARRHARATRAKPDGSATIYVRHTSYYRDKEITYWIRTH